MKDAPAEELAKTVRRVAAGLPVVDAQLATESLLTGNDPLTDREREVLAMPAFGDPVAVITEKLHLSPGTVRNVLSSAIAKTHTSNQIQAAQVASDRGWI